MEEIKITLETLYDILRNEKNREDLQKLNDSFFYDVVNYLKEKKKLLGSKEKEDDLFAAGEREKLEYELRSIKRILKEVYEKREKKIIDIALNKSRTGSDIIDVSSMLREEKDFYDQLMGLLDGYRSGILMNLFKGEVPFFKKPEVGVDLSVVGEKERVKEKKEELEKETEIEKKMLGKIEEEESGGKEEVGEGEDLTEGKEGGSVKEESESNEGSESGDWGESGVKVNLKKIKFTHAVPSFVWKDLKEYGPWEAGEEAELFAEVVDLMVEKGRGEVVE